MAAIVVALGLLAGALPIVWLAQLPPAWVAWPGLVLVPMAWRWRGLLPLAAAAAGFALALHGAHARLEPRLPAALAGADLTLTGHVVGLPQHGARRERFRFVLESAREGDRAVSHPDTVRLTWYGPGRPRVAPGQRWRLVAHLVRPRGFLNPGGFDYARWLFREGIGATGYVRRAPPAIRLAPVTAPLGRLRDGLRNAVYRMDARLHHAGILRALTVGDRGAIGHRAWDVLTATGTNHLVAISGLHIGLAALAGFWLGSLVWRGLGRARSRIARPVVRSLCGLAAACVYAALAGFSLPTLRALVMLAVALGACVLRRRARPAEGLALAAVAALVVDPLAPMSAGFWLSFGAVAAILFVMCARVAVPGRLRGWTRLQWAIAVALLPVLIGWFGRASLVAPLANLVAVPWVSVLTVPPALAGAVTIGPFPAVGAALLTVADRLLDPLWHMLQWMAHWPLAQWWRPSPPDWALVLACAGAALLLAPRGVPGRLAGLAMMVPLVGWSPPRPPPGAVDLDVLDVGQGLATVVRTHAHTLVYDTGPRFSTRFDAGNAVVVPFLRAAGVGHLDALVVSHGDNDHAGGVRAVRGAYPPGRLWSSVPQRFGEEARFCAAGTRWHWDGVGFSFVHPGRDGGWLGNDASCVLRIAAPGGTLLLPGDIEAPAEGALVRGRADVAADVVVAPHHGSATSSTAAFVAAVDPRWVLYSVGYHNRYGFPVDPVVRRWRPAGLARTDCGGALHVVVDPRRGPRAPRAWRREHPRFWRSACGGAGKSGTMRAVVRPAVARADGG